MNYWMYIIVWALVALVVLLLFALARIKSERGQIDEQEIMIEFLAESNERKDDMLLRKNDSIKLLEKQVQILNDEVARMHNRPSQSFVKN